MLCRKLREARHAMQSMGHQFVGSTNKSHEDVKLMFEKFFSGESQKIKKALRKTLTPFQAKKLLSQIFQVYYPMTNCVAHMHNTDQLHISLPV